MYYVVYTGGIVLTITAILSLFGGVGLFLYGMSLLGTSLEQLAGAGLEKILEKLTNNKFNGVALGTITTAVIQSSAATTIMVVGFVNAGIMKLVQAVPVVMGANIGSTVTGQILRLGDISTDNIFLTLLKPSSFAPMVIAIGSGMLLFSKKKKTKNTARILIGFGILFMGMTIMEQTVSPLKDNEHFREMFVMFTNPFLGLLVGFIVTAIIQSCSASVGILQAIASTGTVTFSMAFPIILGENIGKCLTVLLGSIGTNKKAKRVSIIYTLFNVIGVVVFMTLFYLYNSAIGIPFWNSVMNRGNIADIQSLFNIATTCVLLPFCSILIKISGLIIKDNQLNKINQELDILDDIFLKTPAVAIEQSKKVIISMSETVKENYSLALELLKRYDQKVLSKLNENERFLDKAETKLNEYLVKITGCNLDELDTTTVTQIMHNISDLERIGDYCVNLANVVEYNDSNSIYFSKQADKEIKCISSAVRNIISMAMEANINDVVVVASRVEPLEEVIDALKESLTDRHLERLQKGMCNVAAGISFVEIITNLERMADHCSNIAVQVIKKASGESAFDTHEHLQMIHDGVTEEYKALFKYYESIYYGYLKGKCDNLEYIK